MHLSRDGELSESGSTLPWQSWLTDCRQQFGDAPRHIDRATENRLLVHPPWLSKLRLGDSLAKLIQNSTLRSLFRNGQVTWGHVVQANQDLFEPMPLTESYIYDRPGEILFSPFDSEVVTPEYLQSLARKIGSLRRAQGLDAEMQSWANYLNAETTRVVGKPVPQRFSPAIACFVSTTLFRRSYLPDGVLRNPLLPVIVAPQQPFYAIPLPSIYWPESLLDWWATTG
ncbi:MAG TPA: hypothetical protein DDZ51_09695 [Planctomycetaceae bacterium]|nr:hypothetical protein [Planctomycetaceae bacterium]